MRGRGKGAAPFLLPEARHSDLGFLETNNKTTDKDVINYKALKHSIFTDMIRGQKRPELVLYAVVWAILFAAPLLSMYVGKVSFHASAYDWMGVCGAWGLLTMFFATFCLHNFLIAPLLVYHSHRWRYGLATLLLMVAFMAYQTMLRPHRSDDAPFGHRPEPAMRQNGTAGHDSRPTLPMGMDRPGQPPHEPKGQEPPRAFGGQNSVAFIIASLLLALNIGAKYYFKSLDDRKRLHDLERDNLNTQLSYLKYQINPHFFMNTLNNIHALVLIDPEQANRMIETLSKLMRYVLYDGNSSLAPLQKEMAFVRNYVSLMQVRYTEKVRISVTFPDTVPDLSVPSLLFATFIENAFKHGVSYENDSFVDIILSADKHGVHFICRNSRLPQKPGAQGGVGLANATKRLQLIYGSDYRLSIVPSDTEYRVELWLPERHNDNSSPNPKRL